MKQFLLSFSLCFLIVPILLATETTLIKDFTGRLSTEQLQKIDALSKEIQQRDNIEFRTILVEKLSAGETSRSQATQLANLHGVGKHNNERGALLFFAVKDRKLYIATSKAVKQQLTTPAIDEVINLYMKPYLKNDNYPIAIEQGIAGLSKQILDPKPVKRKNRSFSIPPFLYIGGGILLFFLYCFQLVKRINDQEAAGISDFDDGDFYSGSYDSGFDSGGSDSFDGSGSGSDY